MTRPQVQTDKGKWAVEILDAHGNWYIPSFCDNLDSLAKAEEKLAKTLRACDLDPTHGRIVEGNA